MVWMNKKEREMMNFMNDTFATKKELKSIDIKLESIEDSQLEISTGIKILKWALGFIIAVVPMIYTIIGGASKQNEAQNLIEDDIEIIPVEDFINGVEYELYREGLIK